MLIQRGDQGSGPPPPLKNHNNIGFLSNSGPDPLKHYEAIEPAFNVGPSSARKRNAILIAFRWRADDGPLIVVFRSSHPSSTKKRKKITSQNWTPSDKKFWIRAWDTESLYHIVKRYFRFSDTALLGGGVWFYTAVVKCEEAYVRGVVYSYQLLFGLK